MHNSKLDMNRARWAISVTAIFLVLSGCSKKQQTGVTENATASESTPSASAGAPSVAATPENISPEARVAQAQAAARAKDYERAMNALALPQQPTTSMTGQELMNIHNAQVDLQNQIAAAAAAGDPKAKAALEAMRQRALYHR